MHRGQCARVCGNAGRQSVIRWRGGTGLPEALSLKDRQYNVGIGVPVPRARVWIPYVNRRAAIDRQHLTKVSGRVEIGTVRGRIEVSLQRSEQPRARWIVEARMAA